MPLATVALRCWRLSAAISLVFLGMIATPTPLPIGLALLGLGLALLLVESRPARRALRGLRHRFKGFSGQLERAGRYLPASLRRTLETTDPGRQDP